MLPAQGRACDSSRARCALHPFARWPLLDQCSGMADGRRAKQVRWGPVVRTIKNKVAIAGIGETMYYKRGAAPVSEFALACEAIMRAADDAGVAATAID